MRRRLPRRIGRGPAGARPLLPGLFQHAQILRGIVALISRRFQRVEDLESEVVRPEFVPVLLEFADRVDTDRALEIILVRSSLASKNETERGEVPPSAWLCGSESLRRRLAS